VGRLIEAVKLWDEPDNLSHSDFELDRLVARFVLDK
jgi:hypothetical protein